MAFLISACDDTSSFEDSRDGKKYKTVKIGEQIWMAQNLDYHGEKDNFGICYENKSENCKKYGRLYDWSEAAEACPEGWFLPREEEWRILMDFVGGKNIAGDKLKAKSGWGDSDKGTNEYGFSALPGGLGNSRNNFTYVNSVASWWSSSHDHFNFATFCGLQANESGFGGSAGIKSNLMSVRCVKK